MDGEVYSVEQLKETNVYLLPEQKSNSAPPTPDRNAQHLDHYQGSNDSKLQPSERRDLTSEPKPAANSDQKEKTIASLSQHKQLKKVKAGAVVGAEKKAALRSATTTKSPSLR